MILRGSERLSDERIDVDVVVVGTGAGGGMAMRELSRAGLSVVALEEGSHVETPSMTQREDEMLPRLYQERGGRMNQDLTIRVLGGRCVGGSTVHNINLCKRLAPEILQAWQEGHAVRGLSGASLAPDFESVERDLSVSEIPASDRNANNRVLQRGVEALGWRGGPLRHNRVGCQKSGFCEVGCPFGAKQNAARVLVPAALAAGATLYTQTQALRVRHEAGRVSGVMAALLDERGRPHHTLEIRSKLVVLAGSAIGSAVLAAKSGLPDPNFRLGRRLHLHPGAPVVGVFDEAIDGFKGIPQSYECTEWLDLAAGSDRRIWITTAFAHPIGAAVTLPGFGPKHFEWMQRYRHIAVLTAMIHDETVGQVRVKRDGRPLIEYSLGESDRRQLARGVRACARLLFAAGAKSVLVPSNPPIELRDPSGLDDLASEAVIPLSAASSMGLAAAHPMSTLPMGDDPKRAVVDSRGQHHQVRGLYVVDGSVFPTSIGGPPQIPIYTLSKHLCRHAVDAHRQG
ncbi:MAG: GMC family oxidoreductase [Polyangiaceae bacterium]